ncbi:MAG TPA: 2-oxo-tetronate isomerase [Devosia sp.]|nr:2-oxo-tetronate isomerase [Devosia sp.]
MPKFAANLSMLYQEHGFLDRFAAAARDGFAAVEYVAPYDQDKAAIAERLRANGLSQVLFNLPPGNWAAGERGIGCLPDRRDEFRAGVDLAIEYAHALDCPQVNCLAGIAPAGATRDELEAVLVENLRYAAGKLQDAGIRLLIEPINQRDIPGFFLTGTDHAERVLEQVGSDNLLIQYDFYHVQIMQGDLVSGYLRLQHKIGHVQIADNPGRGEPGSGEINYPYIFDALDQAGYAGWVGAEYKPRAGTSQGLTWLSAHRAPSQSIGSMK